MRQVRRADHGRQHREISAKQRTLCASTSQHVLYKVWFVYGTLRVFIRCTHELRCAALDQRRLKVRDGERGEAGRRDWPVKSNKASPCEKRQQQCGDVGIADDNFWVAGNKSIVDIREHLRGPRATARSPQRAHLAVAKQRV